jgi:hypothetical protein
MKINFKDKIQNVRIVNCYVTVVKQINLRKNNYIRQHNLLNYASYGWVM